MRRIMKKKKAVFLGSLIISLLFSVIVNNQLVFALEVNEGENIIEVTYDETFNEDKTISNIKVMASSNSEKVEIRSISDPDNRITEKNEALYQTKDNGVKSFLVSYAVKDNIDNEEVETIQTYESTYEVKDIQKIEDIQNTKENVAKEVKGKESISQYAANPAITFDFDAATGTITKIKGVTYRGTSWDPNRDPYAAYSNGEIVIPEKINGVTVKAIGSYALNGYYDQCVVSSFVLPDTIESIAPYALTNIYFYPSGSLKIPAELQSLGASAFGSLSTDDIVFPAVSKLGDPGTGLQGISLKGGQGTLTLPEGMQSLLSDNAIASSSFKKLVLPSTLQSVGRYSFMNNTTLSEVDFSKATNLTVLGDGMFSGCKIEKLDLSMLVNLNRIEVGAFIYNPITELKLPPNLATIGDTAFAFTSLKEAIIPAGVRWIGSQAFYGSKLEHVDFSAIKTTIPQDYVDMGPLAFGGGNRLFYLNIEGINVKSNRTAVVRQYDPLTGNEYFVSVAGHLLEENRYGPLEYYAGDALGDRNYFSIDPTFPGIDKTKFQIDVDGTIGLLRATGLIDDTTTQAQIDALVPTYDEKTGRVYLPVDSVLLPIKNSYQFQYKYFIEADGFDDMGLPTVWSDGGSTIQIRGVEATTGLLTYEKNDGSNEKWETTFKVNTLITKQPATPTRQGYVFTGWYTQADCDPSTLWNFGKSVFTDLNPKTLYAGWAKESINVTLNANGGSWNNGSTKLEKKVESGKSIGTLVEGNPTLNGFLFDGWYEKNDGSGKKWDIANDVVSAPIELFAKWKFDSTLQNPTVLLEIPSKITLKGNDATKSAEAEGTIKVIDSYPMENWVKDNVIAIRSDSQVTLNSANESIGYKVSVYKEDGTLYADNTKSLMELNIVGNATYPKSSKFKLSTPYNTTNKRGIYEGIMTFYVTLR